MLGWMGPDPEHPLPGDVSPCPSTQGLRGAASLHPQLPQACAVFKVKGGRRGQAPGSGVAACPSQAGEPVGTAPSPRGRE